MRTLKKISLISLSFLLSTLLSLLALLLAEHLPFSVEGTNFLVWLWENAPAKAVVAPYLFWTTVVVVALLLILILVVALYPRLYTEVALENTQSGHLQIKKGAIESYVRTLIQEEGVMASPMVKVDLYRNRFKIRVSGRVIPRVAVPEKLAALEQHIRTGLDQFFGITKKLDYQVAVNHIESKKMATSSRVE